MSLLIYSEPELMVLPPETRSPTACDFYHDMQTLEYRTGTIRSIFLSITKREVSAVQHCLPFNASAGLRSEFPVSNSERKRPPSDAVFYRSQRVFLLYCRISLLFVLSLSTSVTQAQETTSRCLCATPETGPQDSEISAKLELIGERQAEDIFGKAVSKSYFIVEVQLSNRSDGSIGASVAIRNLSLRLPDGSSMPTVPPRLVSAEIPLHRTSAAELLSTQEILLPSNSTVIRVLVVPKSELHLEGGKMSSGIRLFGDVSRTEFKNRALQRPGRHAAMSYRQDRCDV